MFVTMSGCKERSVDYSSCEKLPKNLPNVFKVGPTYSQQVKLGLHLVWKTSQIIEMLSAARRTDRKHGLSAATCRIIKYGIHSTYK